MSEHRVLAAPRIIIVYGRSVAKPVVLRDWQQNLSLMQSLVPEAGSSIPRPVAIDSLPMALFWGGEWTEIANDF